MRDLAPKKISDSTIEHVYQIRPEHLNGAGRLFGGRLMEWIDEDCRAGGDAPCPDRHYHRFGWTT